MSKTLYDLLEINAGASEEAIAASYRRLHSKYAEQNASGDPDAANVLIALREAYNTLSDPTRRQRYDSRIANQTIEVIEPPKPRRYFLWLLLAIVVGTAAVTYQKHRAEEERARAAAEQARKDAEEAAANVRLAELEAQRQREERYANERQEAMERATRERELAYSNQVSRDLARAEAEARRTKEYQERQRMLAEQQRQYEAERQLAHEKARLRQMEAENRRYGY